MAQYRTDTKKLDGPSLVTRYEVGMLSDRLTPSGTLTDAFGRIRISDSLTLFDSQHRYQDNGKWNTANTASCNTVHQANESVVDLNVDTTSGHYVYRETKRVFAYQPGKSLLIMNTFVMNQPKANLRQRVGYFSSQNGVFFENDGTTNYMVLRSYVTGAVVETRVPQSSWNGDTFDGTGLSSQSTTQEHRGGLDVTKSNIFWTDVEWLGVGDVRCGFVVNGIPRVAHTFHNDNVNSTTYMTTACLPCRYEIENTGTTSSNSTMKQICSTVITEGGYELSGKQRAVGIPITTPKDIPIAGTFVPIISIRLKSTRLDAIVIPNNVAFAGVTNNTQYRYKIVVNPTLDANAVWTSTSATSSVEYDISATGYTGGDDAKVGYINVGAGSGASVVDFQDGLFKFQLERDSFTNTATIFSLVATGASNGNDALGSIDWEEIVQ
jgi:hypothetical protein